MSFVYTSRAYCSIFAISLTLAGCAHAPPVISCPPPPDAAMVPPLPLQPLPERDLSAREVFTLWGEDMAAYRITAARLAALQAWGRAQCGWSIPAPSGTSSPRQP